VGGDAEPVPPKRFNVVFTDGVLIFGGLTLPFSLQALQPKGWVDISYLDEDFRSVPRGTKRSPCLAHCP
jgi:hypothetical protein